MSRSAGGRLDARLQEHFAELSATRLPERVELALLDIPWRPARPRRPRWTGLITVLAVAALPLGVGVAAHVATRPSTSGPTSSPPAATDALTALAAPRLAEIRQAVEQALDECLSTTLSACPGRQLAADELDIAAARGKVLADELGTLQLAGADESRRQRLLTGLGSLQAALQEALTRVREVRDVPLQEAATKLRAILDGLGPLVRGPD